jgi:5-methyltetrahydropteroyltriglutamate--homocysteine methyltransferase
MVQSAILGYPRVGEKRELKFALEKYWKGKIDRNELREVVNMCIDKRINVQKNLDIIPSNDFSYYDTTLDFSREVGNIPEEYDIAKNLDEDGFDQYFAMARGVQRDGIDLPAIEMTKWFDTNYHYIVPQFSKNTKFQFIKNNKNAKGVSKILAEYQNYKNKGIESRPVFLGPISYLLIGKSRDGVNKYDLLDNLLDVYKDIFAELQILGCKFIQIDEPCLVMELSKKDKEKYKYAYEKINSFKG